MSNNEEELRPIFRVTMPIEELPNALRAFSALLFPHLYDNGDPFVVQHNSQDQEKSANDSSTAVVAGRADADAVTGAGARTEALEAENVDSENRGQNPDMIEEGQGGVVKVEDVPGEKEKVKDEEEPV